MLPDNRVRNCSVWVARSMIPVHATGAAVQVRPRKLGRACVRVHTQTCTPAMKPPLPRCVCERRHHRGVPESRCARLAVRAVALHSGCAATHLLSTFACNWELARRLSLMLPGTPLDYDVHCFAPYYPHDKATRDAHTAHGSTCGGACFFPADPVFRFAGPKYLCVVNRHSGVHFVIRVELMAAEDSGVSLATLEAAAALVSAVRWLGAPGLCARLFGRARHHAKTD